MCNKEFGPVDRLKKVFCSRDCKHQAMRTGRKTFRKTIQIARNAQSLVAYYISKGKMIRPSICEECKNERKIEAAHYDYAEPLKVRWLCCSCHRKWDKKEPKNATYVIMAGV